MIDTAYKYFDMKWQNYMYNMTNQGSITTRQVTNWMLKEGITDKEFSFFENVVDFMVRTASTPRSNCVLGTTKAEKAGLGMPGLQLECECHLS